MSLYSQTPDLTRNLMKKLLVISTLLLAACCARAQNSTMAGVRFYAQPSVVYVFPGDFKNATGEAIALGALINDQHSLEVEAIWFSTHDKSNTFIKVDFMPLLATYKYHFPSHNGVSGYFGAAAGSTSEHLTADFGSILGSYKTSSTVFTYGLQAGVTYALGSSVDLDFGGKVLRMNQSGITTEGNISMLTAGLRFRF